MTVATRLIKPQVLPGRAVSNGRRQSPRGGTQNPSDFIERAEFPSVCTVIPATVRLNIICGYVHLEKYRVYCPWISTLWTGLP